MLKHQFWLRHAYLFDNIYFTRLHVLAMKLWNLRFNKEQNWKKRRKKKIAAERGKKIENSLRRPVILRPAARLCNVPIRRACTVERFAGVDRHRLERFGGVGLQVSVGTDLFKYGLGSRLCVGTVCWLVANRRWGGRWPPEWKSVAIFSFVVMKDSWSSIGWMNSRPVVWCTWIRFGYVVLHGQAIVISWSSTPVAAWWSNGGLNPMV